MGAPGTGRETGLTRGQTAALGVIAGATAVAGVLHYSGAPGESAFVAATIALAGLAWIVSFATEQVGQRFGPAITGFLQSTLGNLPEFFIVVFPLSAGETVVAQTSLIGSLLVNALLVLGLVIVAGARQSDDDCMRFRRKLPNDTVTLMTLATFIIVLTGLSIAAHDPASHHVKAISSIAAIVILVVYFAWLAASLGRHPPPSSSSWSTSRRSRPPCPAIRRATCPAPGGRGSRCPLPSACSRSPASARHSCPIGSSTRSTPRSRAWGSRSRSPAL